MILHAPQNKFQVFFEQKAPDLSVNGVRAIVSSSSHEWSPRVAEFFGGPRYYESNDNNNNPDKKFKSNLEMTQYSTLNNFVKQSIDAFNYKEYCVVPIKDLKVNLDPD
jgi:hypothetical protein